MLTMLKHTLAKGLFALGILSMSIAHAEVELIHQENIFNDQDSFSLKTHGSIRLQALHFDH